MYFEISATTCRFAAIQRTETDNRGSRQIHHCSVELGWPKKAEPEHPFSKLLLPSTLLQESRDCSGFDYTERGSILLILQVVYSFVQRDFLDIFRLVLILLTGEKPHVFFLNRCNHCVFMLFVNDREYASYLIVLFHLVKSWSQIAVVKLKKRDIYKVFGVF